MTKEKSIAVLFAGEMVYKALNPNSDMDVPSMVYEKMEREYDNWLEENYE